MKKSKYTGERIIGFLKQAEAGQSRVSDSGIPLRVLSDDASIAAAYVYCCR